MQSFKMIFSGVTILQGVEFPIFPIDFAWALQQCSATALPVISSWTDQIQFVASTFFHLCVWLGESWTGTLAFNRIFQNTSRSTNESLWNGGIGPLSCCFGRTTMFFCIHRHHHHHHHHQRISSRRKSNKNFRAAEV